MNTIQEFRRLGYDDHEAVVALQSAALAGAIRRPGPKRLDLVANEAVVASIELTRKGAIKGIHLEPALWAKLRPRLELEGRSRRTQVARTVLLCHRQIRGFARVKGWAQIRPPVCAIEDRTGLGQWLLALPGGPPSPVVAEVEFRDSELPLLDAYRRLRAVQEAVWLLAAFIDVPLFLPQAPFAFAIDNGRVWVIRCGLLSGLEDAPTDRFSDVAGIPELVPVDHAKYFSELGLGSREFRVPDLGALRTKYESLSASDRRRFLRACASLTDASNPDLGRSQLLVALVSALEPLLEEPQQCESCQNHIGIAAEFRRFLDRYVQPRDEVREVYESVYAARSKLVHGGWHFDVDEPFLGVPGTADVTLMAAWAATKGGFVKWLHSRASASYPRGAAQPAGAGDANASEAAWP